jgi:hypothetical protein
MNEAHRDGASEVCLGRQRQIAKTFVVIERCDLGRASDTSRPQLMRMSPSVAVGSSSGH